MVDVLDLHHGEVVGQAVVAQVIAERALGLERVGHQPAGDAEVGLGGDRQLPGAADHRHAPAAEHAGQPQLAHALGQRHHGGQRHGRRPADEDVHRQWLVAPECRGVMGGDAAMDLVVQPDLAVRHVLPAGKLHAVHAQIAPRQAGGVGVLGVDLRQGDIRPAVIGAALAPEPPVRPVPGCVPLPHKYRRSIGV